MIIVLYVACIYIREKQIYQMKRKNVLFETILAAGIVGIFFDGATAYTVNHLAEIPASVNIFLHLCFLSFLDIFVFLMFLYMYDITRGLPQKRGERIGLFLPLLINIVVVIVFMPQLEYRKGTFTNYSMGMSAYTCFAMVALYVLAASGIFLHSWKNLERHKQIAISTYLLVTIGVTAYQMFFPEALLTSLVPAVVIVGIYLNQETPLYAKLQKNNEEMVMGFATLVENRDDNTGGHIRRTTAYVKLLAEELRSRGFYKEQLTNDYVANLVMAAPMHDVGKIAIPDAILQKPGKLTDEEFEQEKQKILNKETPKGILGLSENSYMGIMNFVLLIPTWGWIISIIAWIVGKDKSEAVSTQGKYIFNWLISWSIYTLIIGLIFAGQFIGGIIGAIASPLSLLSGSLFNIGTLPFVLLFILYFVFPIIGGVKGLDGKLWKYPLSIPFLK